MSKIELTEEQKKDLCSVADHFDLEDKAVRERQIRIWRKLKLYWNGLNNIYYSEVAHDWRIWDQETAEDNTDQAYYDKRVNVFRAYLESIIAALSITIPPVKCYPDDADNSMDLLTAKAGDKIGELIFKHNNAPLLWLHALYVLCTEGMVAAYSYTKEDEKYGTYEEDDIQQEEMDVYKCPTCGEPVDAEKFTEREKDEFQPDNDDAALNNAILNEGMVVCENCSQLIDPNHQPEHQVVSRIVGTTRKPKSRQCIEVYGGLYVKVPNYAIKQSDIPYLRFSYETHYANVMERYEDNNELKSRGSSKITPGTDDPYEAWGRLSTQYNGEYPTNTVTVNNYWLRPSAFNVLQPEKAKALKKKFPNGCKLVKINSIFAEAINECLDDCWTLTYNPLSDNIHHDPLGLLLVSVQDITNDLLSLTVQTIEHGIPQTFADPTVLNFESYRNTEIIPGGIYPATPKGGKSIGDGFYEVKTATLSGEVLPFAQNIQQLGQMVSGALPSLFGGVSEGTSKTASEYSMSRSQALQRLQTNWKMMTFWWKDIFGKVIPAYIKDMMDDEKFVDKDANGNFVNVFIRKAELEGKIGSVELEANEQLPLTWSQKKDAVEKLLGLNNPLIAETLLSPENIPVLSDILGLNDLSIPGAEDRDKQFEEIHILLNTTPIPNPNIQTQDPNQPPQDPELPSIEPEPQADNHQVHIDICKHWLVSAAGREAKVNNAAGYQNVLLHLKAHLLIQQVDQMRAQSQVAQNEPKGANPSKSPESPVRAPIGNE